MAQLKLTRLAALGDDYPLEVACYAPLAKPPVETAVVINAGAGVNKRLYEPLACWLADQGLAVYTYDYRGIGRSRGKSIRGLEATVETWGSKDCAAILAFVRARHPASKICIFSHSIGSIVTGFVRDLPKIDRMVMLSPHTGYSGDYARRSKLQMFLLWHVLAPSVSRIVGYFPGRALGLPEDLPLGIVRRWGSRRSLWALRQDALIPPFAHIETRILALRPYDDAFATHDAFARVTERFPKCRFTEMVISDTGSGRGVGIGHFGFFNPANRQLWSLVLQWFTASCVGCCQ
jgi:predicted alpha/beta hydrolase